MGIKSKYMIGNFLQSTCIETCAVQLSWLSCSLYFSEPKYILWPSNMRSKLMFHAMHIQS